jgi:hypothetical protein
MPSATNEAVATHIQVQNCIYCGRDKPLNEFSLEHIFPESLGGALCNDLFKTRRVCQRCNNLAGLFIDGPFIKSWFRNNDDALASREYLSLEAHDSTLPLIYMGEVHSISTDEEVCESWLGPSGEHVYHFHMRDDERFASYLGGDPIARRKDTGRAYLALTASHPWWISLALRSFTAHFRRARRYALNFQITADPQDQALVHNPDEHARTHIAKIGSLGNGPRSLKMNVQINVEARFAAKVARALGYNLFGDRFLATPYAEHLKSAMWEQDDEVRGDIPVQGSGLWATSGSDLAKILAWRGAYSVVLAPTGDLLGLSVFTPSGRSMHVAVSDQPEMWSGVESRYLREGFVYIIAPQAKKFVGPVSLTEYVAHVTGAFRHAGLGDLETTRLDLALLPSRDQPQALE